MAREPVRLNVYNMYWVNDYLNSMGIGVYHSGIEIYRIEYAYGSHPFPFTGIFENTPKDSEELGDNFKFKESVLLGYTDFNENDVKHLIDVLGREFKGDSYHLIAKNCNHFTASFAKDQTHQAQSHVAQPQPMYSAQNMMFHPNPGGAGFPPPGLVYRHPVMGYPSAAISQQRFLPQQQHRPSAQPTSSGSSDAKSRQEFEKQLTLERQRQKLQQIGAGSVRPTQLNPEAMIASIVGPTGTPTRLKNQHLPSQTSAHSTIAPMHQMAGFSQEHSGIHSSDSTKRSEVKQTQHQPEMTTILNPLDPSRPGIEAVMKECAELSVSGSKPRAFHHATLNEIQSTNLQGNQQTFVPDSKATTWSYKQAENLEGIFILPTTPTQAAMRPQDDKSFSRN